MSNDQMFRYTQIEFLLIREYLIFLFYSLIFFLFAEALCYDMTVVVEHGDRG